MGLIRKNIIYPLSHLPPELTILFFLMQKDRQILARSIFSFHPPKNYRLNFPLNQFWQGLVNIRASFVCDKSTSLPNLEFCQLQQSLPSPTTTLLPMQEKYRQVSLQLMSTELLQSQKRCKGIHPGIGCYYAPKHFH